MADKERPAAVFAPSIRSIKVYRSGRIEYQKKSGSIIGATARVDSSGSKHRLRDTRRVVLTIEGPRVAISAVLPAGAFRVHREAREFAATVNEMATRLAEPTPLAEPTSLAEPTPLAEPTSLAEPTPLAEPTLRAEPTPLAEPTLRAEPTPVGDPSRAQTAQSPPSSPPPGDLLDYLERLGRLRDSGVLTEDEFQAQKDRLLRAAEP